MTIPITFENRRKKNQVYNYGVSFCEISLFESILDFTPYAFNRLTCHSIFTANSTRTLVCTVVGDTYVFILLLYVPGS